MSGPFEDNANLAVPPAKQAVGAVARSDGRAGNAGYGGDLVVGLENRPAQGSARSGDVSVGLGRGAVEGQHAPGFPRFKPASRWRTIDLDDASPGMVRRRGRHTVLAVKGLAPIRLRTSRPLPASAMLRSVRIVRKPVRTEVHLCYALPAAAPARPVGIDVGVARRLTLSTGEALARRTPGRRRLRRLQRRIARARHGSRGRRQAVRALGRAWQRLRDADRQALHRLAHALCARFDGFAVEDLDVRNLTRSARGTAAAPGVRVAQKRGLNRAIADQGWATFVTILRDQAASAGLPVIAVPAHGRGLADVPPPVATAGPGASHASGAGRTTVPSSGALVPLLA